MLGLELEKNPHYSFVINTQDLDALCEYFPFIPRSDITGAMVLIDDGDYREVFVTESSCPWSVYAHFQPLAYYEV